MVEYRKKRIQLQSGGSRNYYYKVLANGEKKRVNKEEYLARTQKNGGGDLYTGPVKKVQNGKTFFGYQKLNTNKSLDISFVNGKIVGKYDGKNIQSANFSPNNKKKLSIRTSDGMIRDVRFENESVHNNYKKRIANNEQRKANNALRNASKVNNVPANVVMQNEDPIIPGVEEEVNVVINAPVNTNKPNNIAKTNNVAANVAKTNNAATNVAKTNNVAANVAKTNNVAANVAKTNNTAANVPRTNNVAANVAKTNNTSGNTGRTNNKSTNNVKPSNAQ